MQARSASQSPQSYQVSGLCRGQDWTTTRQNSVRFSNPHAAITPICSPSPARQHQRPPQGTKFQASDRSNTSEILNIRGTPTFGTTFVSFRHSNGFKC